MHLDPDATRMAKVLEQIADLDLAPIKFKISSKEDGFGWTPEHVDRVEHGYRRFLALLAMYPGRQLAPTKDIDKFWHAHILDTRKYAQDCELIFGEFLHHNPYLGMRNDKDRLDEAAMALHQLVRRDFGESVPANAASAQAPADPAWCGGETTVKNAAAWCGGETTVKNAAAWCGGETTVKNAAAWCGGETTVKNEAAWCGGETTVKNAAAWCGGETTVKNAAAWCGGETTVKNSAAWCGGETTVKNEAAWCGGETTVKNAAAWCGGETTAKDAAAWCGGETTVNKAPAETASAWCGGEVAAH